MANDTTSTKSNASSDTTSRGDTSIGDSIISTARKNTSGDLAVNDVLDRKQTTLEDIRNTLKDEGLLIRNKGTNSLASIKIELNKFQPLFDSMNKNMITQTRVLQQTLNELYEEHDKSRLERQIAQLDEERRLSNIIVQTTRNDRRGSRSPSQPRAMRRNDDGSASPSNFNLLNALGLGALASSVGKSVGKGLAFSIGTKVVGDFAIATMKDWGLSDELANTMSESVNIGAILGGLGMLISKRMGIIGLVAGAAWPFGEKLLDWAGLDGDKIVEIFGAEMKLDSIAGAIASTLGGAFLAVISGSTFKAMLNKFVASSSTGLLPFRNRAPTPTPPPRPSGRPPAGPSPAPNPNGGPAPKPSGGFLKGMLKGAVPLVGAMGIDYFSEYDTEKYKEYDENGRPIIYDPERAKARVTDTLGDALEAALTMASFTYNPVAVAGAGIGALGYRSYESQAEKSKRLDETLEAQLKDKTFKLSDTDRAYLEKYVKSPESQSIFDREDLRKSKEILQNEREARGIVPEDVARKGIRSIMDANDNALSKKLLDAASLPINLRKNVLETVLSEIPQAYKFGNENIVLDEIQRSIEAQRSWWQSGLNVKVLGRDMLAAEKIANYRNVDTSMNVKTEFGADNINAPQIRYDSSSPYIFDAANMDNVITTLYNKYKNTFGNIDKNKISELEKDYKLNSESIDKLLYGMGLTKQEIDSMSASTKIEQLAKKIDFVGSKGSSVNSTTYNINAPQINNTPVNNISQGGSSMVTNQYNMIGSGGREYFNGRTSPVH